jgi:hypothetical protein
MGIRRFRWSASSIRGATVDSPVPVDIQIAGRQWGASEMGFFDRFRRAPRGSAPTGLLGCWRLTHADTALGLDPEAVMEFAPEGRLTYTIPGPGTAAVMLLTYRVEGTILVTDQPSAPREERTGFQLSGDRLTLDYGGAVAHYARSSGDALKGPVQDSNSTVR